MPSATGRCAAADLRGRDADPDAHPHRRHRRRDRRRDRLADAARNEDFNISAGDERTVAELARIIWEACDRPPAEFALEHLPTYPVDVVRRWPDVSKARELLGWEAQISDRDGIAQTVAWLRTVME